MLQVISKGHTVLDSLVDSVDANHDVAEQPHTIYI